MFEKDRTFGDVIAEMLFKVASDSVNRKAEVMYAKTKKRVLLTTFGIFSVGIGALLFLVGVVQLLSEVIGRMDYALLLVGAILAVIGALTLPKN